METNYVKVKQFEDNLYIHSCKYFSKHLNLFDELMELYLEPLDGLTGALPTKEEGDPLLILLARIFNDFESSKLLLLRGYTEPAQMPMRDIIECMMLFRLFINDSKLALRWMNNLKEYRPASVKKRLDELEVDCPEYIYYGLLSELTHANLLSAMSVVTEKRLTHGLISRAYNFGGMNNPTWIGLIFIDILILLFLTLQTILPQVYFDAVNRPGDWWDKVGGLTDRLVELGANIQVEEVELTDKEKKIRDQTLKKLGKLVQVKTTLFDKKKVAEDKGFPEL